MSKNKTKEQLKQDWGIERFAEAMGTYCTWRYEDLNDTSSVKRLIELKSRSEDSFGLLIADVHESANKILAKSTEDNK